MRFPLRRGISTLLILTACASLLILIITSGVFSNEPVRRLETPLTLPSAPAADFLRSSYPAQLSFPDDFGPHPEYQTEWWYYTGNLTSDDGRPFGYQLTFFRRGLLPEQERDKRSSSWATNDIYMAHFALSDISAGRFHAFERFSRGGAGLAGAQAEPYRVWLENWSVEEIRPGVRRMQAEGAGVELDLMLQDTKGPILQGEEGYSQKGPDPGNASYYYSLTRLLTSGTLRVNTLEYTVTGASWMDHEYSTSALADDQIGWDWFALQLDGNVELMVFQIRRSDGSVDPFSSGTYIDALGNTIRLRHTDFEISVLDTWRSPHSGATYPSRWSIRVPQVGLTMEITPLLADQELRLGYTYWEGAVSVAANQENLPIAGRGYVELTGYAMSMQGQF